MWPAEGEWRAAYRDPFLVGRWQVCTHASTIGAPPDAVGIEFEPPTLDAGSPIGIAHYLVVQSGSVAWGTLAPYSLRYDVSVDATGAVVLDLHHTTTSTVTFTLFVSTCPREMEWTGGDSPAVLAALGP